MSEKRTMELKKAIIDWLFENKNAWQRTNACREYFRPYIYNSDGNYLIGGEEVSEFITSADKLIYGQEELKIGTRGLKVTTNDRIGEIRKNTFGTDMQIVAYRTSDDMDVKFLDKDGYVFQHTTYSNFKTGQIKNPYDRCIFGIGYLGEGNAQQKTQVGYCWRGMLERCYCDRMKKIHPAYYGISTVCEEWLNFQVFAKWYNENVYQIGTERMHLDKDILFEGNKIYSPDTCIIVPQSINELFHTSGRKVKDSDLPHTIKRAANGRYSVTYKGKSLGIRDTVEECTELYLDAKRKHIREKVEEMKDEMPEKVQKILLAW